MNVHTRRNSSRCHLNYLFEYVTLNMFRLSCVIDFTEPLKIATAMDELGTAKSKAPHPGARKRRPEPEASQGNGRRCHRDSVSRRRGVAPPVTDRPAVLETAIKRGHMQATGDLD